MNSSKFREYSLSSSVDSYITTRLEWPRMLGKVLLREKDVSKGRKVTFLPEDTNVESIVNFEHGGITRRESSIEWLVAKMQEFLNQSKNPVIVLQDAFAKPKDPYIQRSDIPAISYKDEVYFGLSQEKAQEPDYIKETLVKADSHFMIGVMSNLPESRLPLGKNLKLDLITILARRTEHIILSVFDEEGYIICSFNN